MALTLQERVAKATQLTQEGRLTEAMAILQQIPLPAQPRSPSTAKPQALKRGFSRRDAEPASRKPSGPAPTRRGVVDLKAVPVDAGDAADRSLTSTDVRTGLLNRLARAVLRSRKTPPAPEPQTTPVSTPRGSRFEDFSFANSAGFRTYKLFVPSRYSQDVALPLIVMLHGCKQWPEDFAAGTQMNEIAEELGFLVAYPRQPESANPSKCWNWFNAGDQRRDSGEPSIIAGITRQVMKDFNADPDRVYVAGLSAGGAAAAIMGAAYPDLYAAIGVHSGLACGAARDMPSAFSAMRRGGTPANRAARAPLPSIVFHGDRDRTVHVINSDQVVAQAKSNAHLILDIIAGQSPDGTRYTRTVQADLDGRSVVEQWIVHGTGHAWSGGNVSGSYTDPRGPDASREMVRFFLEHPKKR